jgi:hypothetical protein
MSEELKPKIIGAFQNHADWVNRASRELAHFKHEYGHKIDAICVDAIGRRCTCGGDFARARDEGTFPVYYFIECQAMNTRADLASQKQAESGDNALEALERMESTWYTGDMAEDWSHDGDIETIRTALTQSAEKDTVILELSQALNTIHAASGFHSQNGVSDHCMRYAHESNERLCNETLKTHAETIKRAGGE